MVKPTSVRQTRERLADVLGEAFYRNELFRIERKDKPVAYLAGAPTMERLAELFKPVLLQCVLHIIGSPRECVRSPCRYFLLHQDAVAIAEIEHAAILRPMHARIDAV